MTTTFGELVRSMRQKAQVPSTQLAAQIGKGNAYVSQIESGKIKKPDYDTSVTLLTVLGVPESKISQLLEYFDILSPEAEAALLEAAGKEQEWEALYHDGAVKKLKLMKQSLSRLLEDIIDRDFGRAEVLIPNLYSLLQSKKDYEFVCTLLGFDYTQLSEEEQRGLTHSIRGFIGQIFEEDRWGDLQRKGGGGHV